MDLIIRNVRKTKIIDYGEYDRIIIRGCKESKITIKPPIKIKDHLLVENSNLEELNVLAKTIVRIENSEIKSALIAFI